MFVGKPIILAEMVTKWLADFAQLNVHAKEGGRQIGNGRIHVKFV